MAFFYGSSSILITFLGSSVALLTTLDYRTVFSFSISESMGLFLLMCSPRTGFTVLVYLSLFTSSRLWTFALFSAYRGGSSPEVSLGDPCFSFLPFHFLTRETGPSGTGGLFCRFLWGDFCVQYLPLAI